MAVLIPVSLWAQDAPKAEFFGGFSVLTIKDSGTRTTPVGWQAAISGNVNKMFSIVGDFGGEYKNGGSALTYMGGARVTKRAAKTAIFAHALYGATHFNSTFGGGNNFTMGYGGGVDVNATDKVAIRLVQFDWLPLKDSGTWLKNSMRFGFGVVLKK
jgi:hypothetical protein